MFLSLHQAVPQRKNNSEENTKQKKTAKTEVLYQQTHAHMKNLYWFPTALVTKHKLLTRAGKKGLYNAGPAPWQQGTQRTPIPKHQSHLS